MDFIRGGLALAGMAVTLTAPCTQRLTSALVEKLRKYGQNDPELQYLAEQIDFNDYFTKHKT